MSKFRLLIENVIILDVLFIDFLTNLPLRNPQSSSPLRLHIAITDPDPSSVMKRNTVCFRDLGKVNLPMVVRF
jgi:hypothetical protein